MKQIAVVVILVSMPPLTTVVRAETSMLKTQPGKDISLSVSSYQYQEPGVMSSDGLKMGLDLRATKLLQNDQFIRGDLRYAFGTVDYTGSGTATGEPDMYVEIRGLVGKDIQTKTTVFAPYTGFGYRYLFNDARGITSTGNWGYSRESNYLYMPFGIILREMLDNQGRLESTLEYDHLLVGKQISRLSDGGTGYSDVTNTQNSGYGLKFDVMYQKNIWAVGPFLHYWNIDKSDTATLYQNGVPVSIGWEPENNTVEIGLKARRGF